MSHRGFKSPRLGLLPDTRKLYVRFHDEGAKATSLLYYGLVIISEIIPATSAGFIETTQGIMEKGRRSIRNEHTDAFYADASSVRICL